MGQIVVARVEQRVRASLGKNGYPERDFDLRVTGSKCRLIRAKDTSWYEESELQGPGRIQFKVNIRMFDTRGLATIKTIYSPIGHTPFATELNLGYRSDYLNFLWDRLDFCI